MTGVQTCALPICDLEEWQSMVSGIKKLAEAFEDIEEDDFDE